MRMPSQTARLAPYLGYATCYVWTFCTSSIYEFGGGPSAGSFAVKVLPGVVTALAMLALAARPGGARACARFMRTPLPAFLAALGTLVGIMPEFAATSALPHVGMALAGVFFLPVLAQWCLAYARLPEGRIVALSGVAFLVAAACCVGISNMPLNAAAFVVSLMPLVGFACLRAPGVDVTPREAPDAARPHRLPWKTCAGLFAIFFAYNGVLSTQAQAQSWLGAAGASFLVLPTALAAAAVAFARMQPEGRAGAVAARVALIAVAVPFMALSWALETPAGIAFADGLAMYAASWAVLACAVREAGRDAQASLATFAAGWLSQTLGGALAYPVAPLATASPMLHAFLMVALGIVSGVEFFSASPSAVPADVPSSPADAAANPPAGASATADTVPSTQAAGSASSSPAAPAAEAAPSPQADLAGAFCKLHGLSAREEEVFRLWVTGHGVRSISERLAMSESTAKTHVRHIYDKCGTYGKAQLLAAYEEWAGEQAR